MIRKTIFWTHLVCGVAAALVILMMSATGLVLTYERQLLAWAEPGLASSPAAEAPRQTIDSLVSVLEAAEPDIRPSSIRISADRSVATAVMAGRNVIRYADPFSGEILGAGPTQLRSFFAAVTGWHRWFNATGENRALARAITGASNLMFLFLLVSGLYLWLPRVFSWALLRSRLVFAAAGGSAKARDFNWHHVIGIWTALPLIVVVASATVFYYPLANELLYRSVGEQPPARRAPSAPAAPAQANPVSQVLGAAPAAAAPVQAAAPSRSFDPRGGAIDGSASAGHARPHVPHMTLDNLSNIAAKQLSEWRTITLNLPQPGDDSVRFTIDQGNGGQPQRRHTLVLDSRSGEVRDWQPFDGLSPGRRARSWVRFLHTGEALGVVGQSLAGLVSFTTMIMVWTGLALAYRRIVQPMSKKRRARR
jgi:uncharacterized iron-regulated membrane protein